MRSDERERKSAVFSATGGRMLFATGLEGGVLQFPDDWCCTTDFAYLSHTAVVIPCESARPCRTGEKEGDESDPPKKWGACDPG